jgi:transcriptional regulator with XRE-family HTH domain
MLSYFPYFYEDELLYSAIARYHVHVGNIKLAHTLQDLYGKKQIKAIPDLASHLNQLYNRLVKFGFSSIDEIIDKHTMYFYYTNFVNDSVKSEVRQLMKSGQDLGKAYRILGLLGNKIKEISHFKFCPKCLTDDLERYGESYWRLSHQLPTSFVCSKHKQQVLLLSQVPYRKGSRTEYIAVSEENCSFSQDEHYDIIYSNKEILTLITEEGVKLAKKQYSWNIPKLHETYRFMLSKRGYLTVKGAINQTKLGKDLISYYGKELLKYLNCEIKPGDNNCWLRLITSKHRNVFHPLKHILLLVFLQESIDNIEENENKSFSVFGEGPYPCLNPAAEHYGQRVINDVQIKRDHNTGNPRGLFVCGKCGFSYSRIGPDNDINDQFRYNKVIEYGPVWKDKLNYFINEENLSQKETAKRLKVSVETVRRYLNGFEKRPKKEAPTLKKLNELKKQWLNLVKQYPNYSQNQIRELDKRLYTLLYHYDKEWLQQNSPIGRFYSGENNRVNWEDRDKQALGLIKKAIEEILNEEKPIRITIHRIEQETGISKLKTKLEKMPQTKEFLLSKLESVEQFQLRRAKWAIEMIKKQGMHVSKSKVMEMANLHKASIETMSKIDKLIESYNC